MAVDVFRPYDGVFSGLNQLIYAVGEWELMFMLVFVSYIRARWVRGEWGGQCY